MDFWQTVLVVFRRWYIALPVFLGTLLLSTLAYGASPTVFQSNSVLVLTTPVEGGTQSGSVDDRSRVSYTNPLLSFSSSLNLTATLLIQEMQNPQTAAALGVRPGGSLDYVVNNGTSNPELLQTGPFVFISATGPTPGLAQEMAERVADRVADDLARRQRELKAPRSTHIGIERVVSATPAQPLIGSSRRAAAASLALAAFLTLAAVYGADSFFEWRSRRRNRRGPAPSGAGVEPPAEADDPVRAGAGVSSGSPLPPDDAPRHRGST
ncbi:hypothetical protein [Nocardioides sp. YIM 152588]|uniref:hypothetical protein n=1 Tax=Nocardioides sp. YIM 152588 TaxID=3158259 RepID=UPI0032E48F9D